MYNKINVQRHQEERECPNCGKTWTIWTQIFQPENCRFYHFCKDCQKDLTPWQRKKIKMEKVPGFREQYLKGKREEFIRSYVKHMVRHAEIRAARKGIEFNITEEDIIIPEKCPLLEVPLEIGTKNDYEYSPSLDRKDNTKGYTKDNIWIISKKANSMKNSATTDELDRFCKNVLRYSLNNDEKEIIESENKKSQR
jgi:hypothetical protein